MHKQHTTHTIDMSNTYIYITIYIYRYIFYMLPFASILYFIRVGVRHRVARLIRRLFLYCNLVSKQERVKCLQCNAMQIVAAVVVVVSVTVIAIVWLIVVVGIRNTHPFIARMWSAMRNFFAFFSLLFVWMHFFKLISFWIVVIVEISWIY